MVSRRVCGIFCQALFALIVFAGSALAQSPTLFFSDLQSGPKTGGENNKGAYVTIYGNFFGATQGSSTVTVGGGAVDHCPVWGATWLWYQKITCQLGANAATGNIVVTVNGQASNGLPFTVRNGNIYFVDAVNGNNANDGSFEHPVKDVYYAKDFLLNNGAIAYLRAGTWSTVEPSSPNGVGDGASLLYMSGYHGSADLPLAFVGYPGETATLAVNRGGAQSWDIRSATAPASWYTFAELDLGGTPGTNYIIAWENYNGGDGMRFVGNNIHGSTGTAVVMQGPMNGTAILGNNIHHYWALENGANRGERGYGVYFGGYGVQQNLTMNWNMFNQDQPTSNAYGTKGIDMYGHLAGDQFRNVVIGNNQFFDNCREAILMGGSDGGTPVFQADNTQLIYNNLFVFNGECDTDYGYSAIAIQTGRYAIYNNTFYHNGNSPQISNSGDIDDQGIISADISNNIFDAPPSASHYCGYICFEANITAAGLSGSNNLFLNFGNGPSFLTGNINGQDPLFANATTNAATANYYLQGNSPAIDAGAAISAVTSDITGKARPQGAGYDIGAYEYGTGSAPPSQPPAAPTATLTASPASIIAGQTSMLAYSCTNCTSATINGAATSALSGQQQVTPSATTTYTLVATGAGGSATATAIVTVGSAPAPPPPPPLPTASLSASPTSITQGQSSTLTYSCANCTSIVVNGSPAASLSGQAQVSPAGTTTYTVTAFGAGGSATATATVTVSASAQAPPPPPPVPTATLSAAPTSITQGQSSVLTYSCTNCTSAKINGVATASLSGQMQVTPTATTTYTLTVTGDGGSASATAKVTVTATPPPPPNTSDLTVDSTHTGNFSQGQTGAHYTITVNNIGSGATSGTVTVTDTLPAGLTATAISGTGWTCTLGTLKCTRTTALAAGASYSLITLTVNVAANAPGSVINSVAISGGGEQNTSNDTDIDLTLIGLVQPDLGVSIIQDGDLSPGQTGVVYTVVVSNVGNLPTSGTVTLTDTLSAGLTATAIGGTGWTCTLSTLKCTRSNALAAGLSYPAVNVTVNVATNAPSSVTNTATVSGGNEQNTSNDTATDIADVTSPAMLSLDPGTIQFSAGVDSGLVSQTVQMQNLGGGTLGWVQTVQTDSGNGWLVAGPVSGVAPSTLAVTANPGGLAPGYYTGRIIMSALPGVNAKNSPQTLNVQMAVGGVPQINNGGIANGASFATDAASSPGSITVLFGQGMATGVAPATDLPLPMDLLGTEVFVNGIQAPLYFVSPNQINFQMPFEISGPTATVVVNVNGVQGPPITIPLADQAPGIFSSDSSGKGQAAVLNEDGRPNSASNPASAGSVVAVYLTGMGALFPPLHSGQPGGSGPDVNVTPVVPTVLIGGSPAQEVDFSGAAPGLVGLDQINVRIPAGTPAGSAITLQIQTTKGSSNTVTIAVR